MNADEDAGVLVYQDESDDGEELNQMMEEQDDGESDYDSQSDDEDEQI